MGQSIEISCDCGYRKNILVGEGRAAIDLDLIRRAFTPEQLADFERDLESGALDYGLGSKAAVCFACKEIYGAPSLRYSVNGLVKILVKPCEDCGGALYLPDEISCPKCLGKLQKQFAGHWD